MTAATAKMLLAAALLFLPGTRAQADYYNCYREMWCNRSAGCNGTGYAYADCQIWCYENGGQILTGWADCYIPI